MTFPSGKSARPLRKQGAAVPAPKHGVTTPKLFIFMCMLPWTAGFLIFTAYPMIASFYQSFTYWDMINPPQWLGIDNYQRMFFHDDLFWKAFYNTMWISATSIPIRIAFAMLTAFLLTKAGKTRNIWRTIYFLPSMVPVVAGTLIFAWLFQPYFGVLNLFLEKLGLISMKNPPMWFDNPALSKWSLIIMGLWGIGDTMIIFLAGLLDIDRSLYEAASLEGANGIQQFRYVTLPLMTPVIFFSAVTGVIGSFQYFTQAYIATGLTINGDYTNSMYFYATHIYETAFQQYDMGYAAAMSWFLLLITLLATVTMLLTQKRWVHYPNGTMFK
jgi:multiple sugar transport system permease protein